MGIGFLSERGFLGFEIPKWLFQIFRMDLQEVPFEGRELIFM